VFALGAGLQSALAVASAFPSDRCRVRHLAGSTKGGDIWSLDTADQNTPVWAGAIASDNCTYRKWPVAQPGVRGIELSREFCLVNQSGPTRTWSDCPPLALKRPYATSAICSLPGEKRTSDRIAATSLFDPTADLEKGLFWCRSSVRSLSVSQAPYKHRLRTKEARAKRGLLSNLFRQSRRIISAFK
jgi:hypothetical protein